MQESCQWQPNKQKMQLLLVFHFIAQYSSHIISKVYTGPFVQEKPIFRSHIKFLSRLSQPVLFLLSISAAIN